MKHDIMAVQPEILSRIATEESWANYAKQFKAAEPQEGPKIGRVAVIPIYGIIHPKGFIGSELFGIYSLENLSMALSMAINDDSITKIFLDFHSPGGSVYGVTEAAAQIREARKLKPVIATTSTIMASAAYWLASQATQIHATKSAEVGSIGVYTTHEDISAALEKEGAKITIISAGENKTLGTPYEPLTEVARAEMQEKVDQYYSMFINDVALGRGIELEKVLADFGQGKTFLGDESKKRKMVDDNKSLVELIRAEGTMISEPAIMSDFRRRRARANAQAYR